MNKKKLAIVMFSGGLDSLIATRILQEQDIDVIALIFKAPFINVDHIDEAIHLARELDIEYMVEDMGDEALSMIINPRFGYGSGINPCRDCKILMLKKAKSIMESMTPMGAMCIATGDVVGQRPNSQLLHHLRVIDKESDLKGRLLRPLSAKLLDPTIPEIQGIINRNALYDIQGRSRKKIIELFHKYNFPNFPKLIKFPKNSAGCILTDKNFADKTRDHISHNGSLSSTDFEILRIGRHIRINDNIKFVIGRNERENNILENIKLTDGSNEYTIVKPHNFLGPSVLIIDSNKSHNLNKSSKSNGSYKSNELPSQAALDGSPEKVALPLPSIIQQAGSLMIRYTKKYDKDNIDNIQVLVIRQAHTSVERLII